MPVGWIDVEFGTDRYGAQRKNATDFGDPQTFPLAPPADHKCQFSCDSQHLQDCLEILRGHSWSPDDVS